MKTYRGKQSTGNYVYGYFVTSEYMITFADGVYRNILNKDGSHIVFANTVEVLEDNNFNWTKLPSKYAEQREQAYKEYHKET